MKSFSTGGTYINFLTEDEGPERTEAALGTALRATRRGQGEMGSAERVPHEPEHRAGLGGAPPGTCSTGRLSLEHGCGDRQTTKHDASSDT